MEQLIINWAFTGFGALIGIVLNMYSSKIKTLEIKVEELAEKNAELQVLVAGNYVTRIELQDMVKALFHKLDKIETKIDGKADK